MQALDDKRLNKQILECYQILQVALGNSHGYENHPVVKHYAKDLAFLSSYGFYCCAEYKYRFEKEHKYQDVLCVVAIYELFTLGKTNGEINLLYAEYPATDPRCIRETNTERVTALFRDKLVLKWKWDIENGRPPKWTNRDKPSFWEEQDDNKETVTPN